MGVGGSAAASPIAPFDIPEPEIGTETMLINIGPQHPATHGVLRLVCELDGETVTSVVPHIGYLHSGFEKLGEHMDYNQYVTITSRMNYLSPISNDICWHHAVETLFGIDLTPRCKVVRTESANADVSVAPGSGTANSSTGNSDDRPMPSATPASSRQTKVAAQR